MSWLESWLRYSGKNSSDPDRRSQTDGRLPPSTLLRNRSTFMDHPPLDKFRLSLTFATAISLAFVTWTASGVIFASGYHNPDVLRFEVTGGVSDVSRGRGVLLVRALFLDGRLLR